MLRIAMAGAVSLSAMTAAANAQPSHPMHAPVQLPHAAVGECYQFVRIDADYETIMRTVVVADGYEIYDVTEPHIDIRTESYVSREAGLRYRVTEPIYETVTETVQLRPGYVRYEVSPARHETVSERILVKEARMVWKRGYVEGAHQVRHDPETGDIWCLVEEPAVYETVHRTVVTEPARIHEIPVDAEYGSITREVLVQPATVEEIHIPAEYGEYTYEILTQDAHVSTRMSHEVTEQIATYSMIADERFEWRLVDCGMIEGYQMSYPQHHDSHGHHDNMSRVIEVPQGDDPYGDIDWDEHDSSPMASADTTLHPGARSRYSRQ